MDITLIKDFLLHNIWLVTSIWGFIYLYDYYLTLYSARLFRAHLIEHIVIEGSYELTPAFQKDVDNLRLISLAFLWRLIISLPILSLLWWLSTAFLDLPQSFYLGSGGLFLREAVAQLRHLRNIALANFSKTEGGLRGRIEFARWFNLKLSSVEFISFGMFFALISLLWGSWFFLGGAIFCLATALQHWTLSNKAYRPLLQAQKG
jgi:hypothetical protein